MSDVIDDVVLIHATRPNNLVPQLGSFLDNIVKYWRYGATPLPRFEEDLSGYANIRKLMFVYVCDIVDSDTFKKPLLEGNELIHNRLE